MTAREPRRRPPPQGWLECVGIAGWFASEYAIEQRDALVDRMAATPARTPAGWVAKATVARELYLRHHGDEADIEVGCLGETERFAWSLINDILAGSAVA